MGGVATGIRRNLPRRAAGAVLSLVRSLRDRRDERRARRLCVKLGLRRWLVSWQREEGGWRARLSSPALVSTLERSGPTRCRAIGRASHALTRILRIRKLLDTPATRGASGSDEPGRD